MPHVSSGDYFVVEYAYERFGYSAVACRSTVKDVEWPINEFIVYQDSQRQRVVRAMRDAPRWEFYCEGEPLDFEDESAYSARLICDRFRRETLLSYLECWGAPVQDPAFWVSSQGAMTFTRAGVSGRGDR